MGCDDLMEPVLDEVVWLLRTSDLGFRQSSMTSRRTAGLGRRRPAHWARFIQQLLDYCIETPHSMTPGPIFSGRSGSSARW